jgi:hypothetical protein
MNKTQLQIDAKAAADLIRDPARWTTGVSARDARGEPRGPYEPDAVCWCAYGAIHRVTNRSGQRFMALSFAVALRFPGENYPHDVNDGPDGHARVLGALDAIAGWS